MCDDGEVLALQRWKGKDTTNGGKLFTRETTYDTRFAEKCLYR